MIVFGAEVVGVKQLKNRVVSFNLHTQHLTPGQIATILTMADFAYVMMKPEDFTTEERDLLESTKVEGSFGKSYSKRLRNVMFLNWKMDNQGFSSWDDYYAHHMERAIDEWKDNLD